MAKPSALFIVATFLQLLASIAGNDILLRDIPLTFELVLGVDIAIVVNATTTTVDSLNPYNDWQENYPDDSSPWYPSFGMNGLYLNLAAVIAEI